MNITFLTSPLGPKIKVKLNSKRQKKGKQSPTAKATEKEHKNNKEGNFSPFLGSIGWKEE